MNVEDDYIEASRICTYGSKRVTLDLIVEVIALVSGLILLGIYGLSWAWIFLIAASTVGLLIRTLGYFVVPKMRFRSEPKFKDEYLLEFDDNGIGFKTVKLESKLEWSLYNKVIETNNLYILVYGKYNFTIIPKRALLTESDRIEFNSLLKRYISN